MRKLSMHFLLSILFLFLFSCNDEEQHIIKQEVSNEAKLNLRLKNGTLPQLNHHKLEIRNNGKTVKSFTDLSNLPSQIDLSSGTYDIEVYSTETTPQFDSPAYGAKQTIVHSNQKASNLNLNLTQANFGVAIAYSDEFKSTYSGYSVVISDGNGELSYTSAETRFGYFFKGPLSITLTYTDQQNKTHQKVHSISAASSSIAPGTNLTVRFATENGSVYEGYYAKASNKTGIELKTILGDIITEGYNSRSYNDLWGIYKKSDLRENGSIWDMYSDNPSGPNPYEFTPGQNQCGTYRREGDCYNREHSVPKSWFNKQMPMNTDMVHLVPTDGWVNGIRSNHPYGEVGSATKTSKNGSKLGSARSGLGYSGTVFEPIDAYKGDFARIYFYFVTRYDDKIAGWDNQVFSSDEYGLDQWVITMLLRWHTNDPVSDKERKRNKYIEEFQNNRNPYVDHPEFVDRIWGQRKTKSKTRTDIKQFELTFSVN